MLQTSAYSANASASSGRATHLKVDPPYQTMIPGLAQADGLRKIPYHSDGLASKQVGRALNVEFPSTKPVAQVCNPSKIQGITARTNSVREFGIDSSRQEVLTRRTSVARANAGAAKTNRPNTPSRKAGH